MKPRYFNSKSELRKWFTANHNSSEDVWIGFYRKNSGMVSVSYTEAVDQALCFGRIDGIRKKIDETRYTNRFTPRRPKSNWSIVNIENVRRLKKSGEMMPSGLEEFARAIKDGRLS